MQRFQHNARLWIACAPSVLLLADLGGNVLLTVAAFGAIITYLFDALELSEAAFVCLWVLVLALGAGLAGSALMVLGLCVRAVGLALLSMAFMVLLGAWGSLQFDDFLVEQPGLAFTAEQLLFALLPVPCVIIPTWGAAALYGVSCTPFVLAATLGASYATFSCGIPASFARTAAADHGACSPNAALAHASALASLPALSYVLLSLSQPTPDQPWRHHVAAASTLTCTPALILSSLPRTARGAHAALSPARRALAALSLVGIVGGVCLAASSDHASVTVDQASALIGRGWLATRLAIQAALDSLLALVPILAASALGTALVRMARSLASPSARLASHALVGAASGACTCHYTALPLDTSLDLPAAALGACALPLFALALDFPPKLNFPTTAPAALLGLLLATLPMGLLVGRARTTWVCMHAGTHLLLALALKVRSLSTQRRRGRRARSEQAGHAFGRVAYPGGYGRPHPAEYADATWTGPVANVSAVAALLLLHALNIVYLDGTSRGAVAMSPILLLLQPRAPPFAGLNEMNRHAPIAAAISVALSAAALADVASRAAVSLPAVLRGVLLLACALPSQMLCCRFLWLRRRGSQSTAWCMLPLNLLPLLLASSFELRDAGAAGLLAGIVHAMLSRRAHTAGLKVL